MDHDIATQCVCIIRHKKGNKKAKIYEAKIISRGEGDEKYNFNNFQKGNEIKGADVAKIIEERNKLIAQNKISKTHFEKYFLIIEYDIPFFRGEFEKYADLFEFMDIPGLNEQSDITINENQNREETNTNNNEENIKNQSNIETNYYFRQIHITHISAAIPSQPRFFDPVF